MKNKKLNMKNKKLKSFKINFNTDLSSGFNTSSEELMSSKVVYGPEKSNFNLPENQNIYSSEYLSQAIKNLKELHSQYNRARYDIKIKLSPQNMHKIAMTQAMIAGTFLRTFGGFGHMEPFQA
jgi:hypothetical protein